jgi:hypothetical protein
MHPYFDQNRKTTSKKKEDNLKKKMKDDLNKKMEDDLNIFFKLEWRPQKNGRLPQQKN